MACVCASANNSPALQNTPTLPDIASTTYPNAETTENVHPDQASYTNSISSSYRQSGYSDEIQVAGRYSGSLQRNMNQDMSKILPKPIRSRSSSCTSLLQHPDPNNPGAGLVQVPHIPQLTLNLSAFGPISKVHVAQSSRTNSIDSSAYRDPDSALLEDYQGMEEGMHGVLFSGTMRSDGYGV